MIEHEGIHLQGNTTTAVQRFTSASKVMHAKRVQGGHGRTNHNPMHKQARSDKHAPTSRQLLRPEARALATATLVVIIVGVVGVVRVGRLGLAGRRHQMHFVLLYAFFREKSF